MQSGKCAKFQFYWDMIFLNAMRALPDVHCLLWDIHFQLHGTYFALGTFSTSCLDFFMCFGTFIMQSFN